VYRRLGETVRAKDYKFSVRKGNDNHQLGTEFIVHYRIVSAVKRIKIVSDRITYIGLRVCWCNVFVLNVHALRDLKCDDSKDSFHEELEQIFFYHFLKYHRKTLVRDFNANWGRKDIFKPTILNDSLH
jgi:hypothetical protein